MHLAKYKINELHFSGDEGNRMVTSMGTLKDKVDIYLFR